MHPAAGTLVHERVRLLRPLGAGGMGSVWVAEHLTLETEVAVKFISAELSKEHPEVIERFKREASAAARIQSPHVVQTFDRGITADGTPYIVMELLRGESLRGRLARAGALNAHDLAPLVLQAGKALEAAHALGIVHRDIKPDNLFLCSSAGELLLKVLDFGIAKTQSSALEPTSVTRTGFTMGTPQYMSPEQLMSTKNVDRHVDLWALAVVSYEALTGALPFEGETLAALAIAITAGRFSSASGVAPGRVHGPLDAWFARAFAVEKDRRFATALELARAFGEAAAGAPGEATPQVASSAVVATDASVPSARALANAAAQGTREWLASQPREVAAPADAQAPPSSAEAPPAGLTLPSMPALASPRAPAATGRTELGLPSLASGAPSSGAAADAPITAPELPASAGEAPVTAPAADVALSSRAEEPEPAADVATKFGAPASRAEEPDPAADVATKFGAPAKRAPSGAVVVPPPPRAEQPLSSKSRVLVLGAAVMVVGGAVVAWLAARGGAPPGSLAPASASQATPSAAPSVAAPVAASTSSASGAAAEVERFTVVAGRATSSAPWLPAFAFARDAASPGRVFAEARKACERRSLALCTEAQWLAACVAHPEVGARQAWTATATRQGFVVRGGPEGCAGRSVERDDGRGADRTAPCCERAVAMTSDRDSPEPVLAALAARVLDYERAINDKSAPRVGELLAERVDFLGKDYGRDSLVRTAKGYFDTLPNQWTLYDACERATGPNAGETRVSCTLLTGDSGESVTLAVQRMGFVGPERRLAFLGQERDSFKLAVIVR